MHQLTTNKLFYGKYRYKLECYTKIEHGQFHVMLEDLCKRDDIKIRSERLIYSFFCDSESVLNEIIEKVGVWAIGVTKPATNNEAEFLAGTGTKKILCDLFPKGGFQYKIHLRPMMKTEHRVNFREWAQRIDRISYSGKTTRWLSGITTYYPEPFVYVKDGQTLSMALLILGNECRKVEEYILRSSINT